LCRLKESGLAGVLGRQLTRNASILRSKLGRLFHLTLHGDGHNDNGRDSRSERQTDVGQPLCPRNL
jgi:hypothetical protein